MTAPKDEKFIVFNRSEFFHWLGTLAHGQPVEAPLLMSGAERWQLQDAVVIRRRDVFAPPALDAYANAIQATVEGMSWVAEGANLEPDTMDHVANRTEDLRAIADYFHLQAVAAWETHRKLPD